jgi:wobble nucleotide-excising tRNase
MVDKGSKIVQDIYKILETRISKLEKELKSQQEVVKKLVICIAELSNAVKKLPDSQLRKSMAFKYPFPTQEINLEISIEDNDDTKSQMLSLGLGLDQLSELSISDNEDFSLSMDTVEFLENLTLS